MTFAVGSLVRARGREWVVLPDSSDDFLLLRPLGGGDDEVAGVYTGLEQVTDATFPLPDPEQHGDATTCRLLRDAVRLGFRNSAGPFRSFARLNVEPRAYQLVPLLMALKLDPLRLLIADDVGIGKTVEACLIAREMLDRGEITKTCVLCPPHLAEQWQREMSSKFNIDAELVLSSTVRRLERDCPAGTSLFEHYQHLIVSIDFIKADRRRDDFLRVCPDFVIVDEAHGCATAAGVTRSRHQRNQVVKGLSEKPERHLILVTATPHSGKDEAFRSLLSLLRPDFAALPDDLSGDNNRKHRRELARHFVLRRRPDIQRYLDEDTAFPDREEKEASYELSDEYQQLFERVLNYVRETVPDPEGKTHHQRVRWWAALGILRALASSPAAAALTLRSRAAASESRDMAEADRIGRASVLDETDDGVLETMDVAPGADVGEFSGAEETHRRRLREFATQADKLRGKFDAKLQKGIKEIATLVRDGWRPIVFCRFIETAEYLAEHLRTSGKLPKGTEVDSVTGTLTPEDRERRVEKLSESERRVLVCTDCLSEGINLQESFDAVMHYDLSWSPTRHEQREGRVDRFGQAKPEVRVLTYWGVDNRIDGIVLEVLLKKHKAIRKALGISVPVPANTNDVVEAIFEGLALRESAGTPTQQLLPSIDEFIKRERAQLHIDWETAAEKEKKSRSLFAQHTIKPDEVHAELQIARRSVGSGVDLSSFVASSLDRSKAVVSRLNGSLAVDLKESPMGLRDLLDGRDHLKLTFAPPAREGEILVHRTHPYVEALASHVMESALDPAVDGIARRCGVMRTDAVNTRTTLLLSRMRFHIVARSGGEKHPLLAEDLIHLAFTGSPDDASWIDDDEAAVLVQATPTANIPPDIARAQLRRVLEDFGQLQKRIESEAYRRAGSLAEAHLRVRESARQTGKVDVEPQLPADILGVYIFLPAGGAS